MNKIIIIIKIISTINKYQIKKVYIHFNQLHVLVAILNMNQVHKIMKINKKMINIIV
jgi:hypothetical protein